MYRCVSLSPLQIYHTRTEPGLHWSLSGRYQNINNHLLHVANNQSATLVENGGGYSPIMNKSSSIYILCAFLQACVAGRVVNVNTNISRLQNKHFTCSKTLQQTHTTDVRRAPRSASTSKHNKSCFRQAKKVMNGVLSHPCHWREQHGHPLRGSRRHHTLASTHTHRLYVAAPLILVRPYHTATYSTNPTPYLEQWSSHFTTCPLTRVDACTCRVYRHFYSYYTPPRLN